jgi:D-proline reductase (dithiol) PrdB
MSHVRYIDKTREYYRSLGYETPYRWAHFDQIPFTPLTRPLAECRVGVVTTGEVIVRDEPGGPNDLAREVYSLPAALAVERLASRKDSYDRHATTLHDVDAFLPLTRLRELAAEGRVGGLASRFHVVYSEYSQGKTTEVDAPEILRRCREDGADAVLLIAV